MRTTKPKTWINKLFLGDNLFILKSMKSEFIDLIYLDPPFNTGRDFIEFNDKWMDMNHYIQFMKCRLIEMRRVLKPTGSIYLHCDPTASHYLKILMDSIFGVQNFRNEIVWQRRPPGMGGKRNHWCRNVDILLFYSKTSEYHFNHICKNPTKEYLAMYNLVEKETGRRYDSGTELSRYSKKTQEKLRKENKVHVSSSGKEYKKCYADEFKHLSGSVWNDVSYLGANSKERIGYPTQKPITLMERIIRASSNRGDVILDPFCGGGTTLHAAQKLGRKWTGIDSNPNAIKITSKRIDDNFNQGFFRCRYKVISKNN